MKKEIIQTLITILYIASLTVYVAFNMGSFESLDQMIRSNPEYTEKQYDIAITLFTMIMFAVSTILFIIGLYISERRYSKNSKLR